MNRGTRELVKYFVRGQWKALFHRITAPAIFWAWRNPHRERQTEAIPVHVLVGRDRFTMACWMLASWFFVTGKNWRVVLHDDGTLQPSCRHLLDRLAIQYHLISRQEADRRMASALSAMPLCAEHRQRSPFGLKLYDVSVMSSHDRYIVLDSDLLFFRTPDAIFEWCSGEKRGCFFMKDVIEVCQCSPAETQSRLGFKVWGKVNAGLALIEREAVNLSRLEYFMSSFNLLSKNLWMVEQTLYALLASEHKVGGTLPEEYEVSLSERAMSGSVMRHYVGAIRHLFYSEGLGRMRSRILADARRKCP